MSFFLILEIILLEFAISGLTLAATDIDLFLSTLLIEEYPSWRDREQIVLSTKKVLIQSLEEFNNYTRKEIFEHRKNKFLNIGKKKSFTLFSKYNDDLMNQNIFLSIKENYIKYKKRLVILLLLLVFLVIFLIK